jgi:hypothetical protein
MKTAKGRRASGLIPSRMAVSWSGGWEAFYEGMFVFILPPTSLSFQPKLSQDQVNELHPTNNIRIDRN